MKYKIKNLNIVNKLIIKSIKIFLLFQKINKKSV